MFIILYSLNGFVGPAIAGFTDLHKEIVFANLSPRSRYDH
jgi:hypothetical protein